MKDNKNVKSFGEFNENLNISDVSDSKINEDRDYKYNELLNELRNVCKRFQVHLEPIDIKEALINVSDIYTDDE
jgi:hypothetical protein